MATCPLEPFFFAVGGVFGPRRVLRYFAGWRPAINRASHAAHSAAVRDPIRTHRASGPAIPIPTVTGRTATPGRPTCPRRLLQRLGRRVSPPGRGRYFTACSFLTTASPTPRALAGFWPVMSRPSSTMWEPDALRALE